MALQVRTRNDSEPQGALESLKKRSTLALGQKWTPTGSPFGSKLTSKKSSRSSLLGALESPGLRRPSNMRKASFLSLSVSVSLASDLDFVAKYNPYPEPMAARSVSFYSPGCWV